MNLNYFSPNQIPFIEFKTLQGNVFQLDNQLILNAIEETHSVIATLNASKVNIFAILGMRNLSALVGEVFCQSLALVTEGLFVKNPHQDGYPDLLAMDEVGKKLWQGLASKKGEKQPFSPFPNGGLEVKATCGSVPTPAVCRKRGFDKPEIGVQRIELATGYD